MERRRLIFIVCYTLKKHIFFCSFLLPRQIFFCSPPPSSNSSLSFPHTNFITFICSSILIISYTIPNNILLGLEDDDFVDENSFILPFFASSSYKRRARRVSRENDFYQPGESTIYGMRMRFLFSHRRGC